jgi:hypothetical protein
MEITEFNEELACEWLEFFDHHAFIDNRDWETCYCTYYFKPRPKEYIGRTNTNREYAIWLINEGKMKGYLVKGNGRAIGWCCANNKNELPYIINNYGRTKEKVLSIVCFIIEKENRNNGIANSILQKIIVDAKEKEYSSIEAYPKKKARTEYSRCHGSYSMYERNGFREYIENEKLIMRIYL